MHYQHGAFDEAQHVVGELGEARLVAQELGRQPVHLEGLIRHVALGVDMAVPHPAGGNAIDQLDAADLDHAVAVERVEAGRLGIEHDLAQTRLSAITASHCPALAGNPVITQPQPIASEAARLLDYPLFARR